MLSIRHHWIASHGLNAENADFLFIQNQTGLTPGNLSAHVKKLDKAGYVRIKKKFVGNFPRTNIALTARGRKVFAAYREKMLKTLNTLPSVDDQIVDG